MFPDLVALSVGVVGQAAAVLHQPGDSLDVSISFALTLVPL